MNLIFRILLSTSLVLAASLSTTGCGQKGDLIVERPPLESAPTIDTETQEQPEETE